MADAVQIEGRLRELIGDLGGTSATIGRDTELKSLGVDSLDLAEVAQMMADEFGAEVPTHDLERVQRVGELVDLIGAYAR